MIHPNIYNNLFITLVKLVDAQCSYVSTLQGSNNTKAVLDWIKWFIKWWLIISDEHLLKSTITEGKWKREKKMNRNH